MIFEQAYLWMAFWAAIGFIGFNFYTMMEQRDKEKPDHIKKKRLARKPALAPAGKNTSGKADQLRTTILFQVSDITYSIVEVINITNCIHNSELASMKRDTELVPVIATSDDLQRCNNGRQPLWTSGQSFKQTREARFKASALSKHFFKTKTIAMIYNKNLKIASSGRQYKWFPKPFIFCIASSLLFLFFSSCKKLVDIPPPTQALAENKVYATDATAIGVLDGMYSNLTQDNNPFQGKISIGLLAGLSADELNIFGTSSPYYTYYRNDLGMLTNGYELWPSLYNNIYKCNAAFEGLQNSTTLTPAVRQQLLGEAKFMRAFFYFYLVNLFGDVPLALSTDAVVNTLLARSPKADVYNQIIADLKEAKDLMSSNYPDATLLGTTSERVRPTKYAAEALLARVYLFTGDFGKAEDEATGVINNTTLYGPLPALNSVFLKNSKEAIWQLQPTVNNLNTVEGQMYVIPPTGPGNFIPVFLSKFLLNSFEVGDRRAIFGNWVDTTIYKTTSTTYDTVPYPFKYKVYASPGVTSTSSMVEYFIVLRLGEQYLIRAEARAQQNKISEAKADLNAIRTRAGLPNTNATDQPSLLTAILEERRHELFCEWGHRWLDLKRTGKVDVVMSVITSLKSNGAIAWRSYQQYYPIAKNELDKASNLVQTPGY